MLAELQETGVSLATEFRLETTRFVIDAGMNNPAVSTGLMPSPTILFFNDGDAKPGAFCENRPRRREPDDATTDNNTIETLHFLSKPENPFYYSLTSRKYSRARKDSEKSSARKVRSPDLA